MPAETRPALFLHLFLHASFLRGSLHPVAIPFNISLSPTNVAPPNRVPKPEMILCALADRFRVPDELEDKGWVYTFAASLWSSARRSSLTRFILCLLWIVPQLPCLPTPLLAGLYSRSIANVRPFGWVLRAPGMDESILRRECSGETAYTSVGTPVNNDEPPEMTFDGRPAMSWSRGKHRDGGIQGWSGEEHWFHHIWYIFRLKDLLAVGSTEMPGSKVGAARSAGDWPSEAEQKEHVGGQIEHNNTCLFQRRGAAALWHMVHRERT
ncbi:hypothetical protein C8J57DRAFT_1242729 [Mycena rebaudengoi]|nr:hypothetical protein C8J57DRAFT_1242729 [Mycena rebaudengoi]